MRAPTIHKIMNVNWLNNLGDRNPQLLREMRGRLQGRSVAATIGIVVVSQILLLLFFQAQIPPKANEYTNYCLNQVGDCVVNWSQWWRDVFRFLTLTLPYAIYIPATYALVTDISRETEKGTLNFLRLSPRSSQNILLGKLAGVPILSYLSLLLLLPLHWVAAILAGIPMTFLVSIYFALAVWGLLLLPITALLGFLGGSQPRLMGVAGTQGLAIVALVAIAWIPLTSLWNTIVLWYPFRLPGWNIGNLTPWFGGAINQSAINAHLFLVIHAAIFGYWLWRVLQRTFRQPTATTLSKRQAYAIVAYGLVFLAGFTFPASTTLGFWSDQAWLNRIAVLASLALSGSLPLIFSLSTPRQMLLDWIRGRQEVALVQRQQNVSPGKRRSAQIHDWLFGEKSPGVIAIWISVLIIYLLLSLMLPWTGNFLTPTFLGLCLSVLLVANYSLLVQLMLLLETAKRYVWAFGSLIFAIVVPGICSTLPGLSWLANYTPGLWLPLAIPYDFVTGNNDRIANFVAGEIVAVVIHLILLVVQVFLFRDRLRQLSRSL
jgi:hypothetical protein